MAAWGGTAELCETCGGELMTWGECQDGICEECSASERCIRCHRGLTTGAEEETGICDECWTEEDELNL